MDKQKLKEKLVKISQLKDNWDSYGAKSFAIKTIDKVNEIIDCLNDDIEQPHLIPSCCGIQFEWENEDKYLEIIVGEKTPDSILYFKGDKKGDEEDDEEGDILNINQINELLIWLYEKKVMRKKTIKEYKSITDKVEGNLDDVIKNLIEMRDEYTKQGYYNLYVEVDFNDIIFEGTKIEIDE